MVEKNFIKLLPWSVEKDNFGSEYKVIDNDIIAVKLKKAKQINNNFTYIKIKIYPGNSFNDKYIKIPKSNGFIITYKNTNNNAIVFCIEQNDIYFYYILPPSNEWTTKFIKINNMKNENNLKQDLNKVTCFTFSFHYYVKKEISDTLYIKEFFIDNYEIITLKNTKSMFLNKFIMEKNILNNLKLFFLKIKMKKNKLFDSKGNPLYCIYPFYLFFVHISYCSICCWISTDENIDFNKKKNLLDVWFSEKFDKIRNSIRDLSYSECDLKYCRPLYSTENIHFDCFKSLTEIRRMYPEIADYLEGKTDKFRGLPRHILNGFDNSCNLACKSCNASKINKQSKITGRKYIEQIEKIGENVNTLEISCFGDPFGSPVYREWLFNFNDSRFPKLKKIQILTNGILWTEKNWKKVSDNVKKYNIEGRISIDGATKETYEYNRGAKFEILIKNLEFIVKLRKRNEINELNLNFVVQQNNYKEIPLIIDFAKKYSFDSIALVKIGNWGLYKDEDFEKINIFNNKHPEYKTFKNLYQKIKISKNNGIDVEFRFEL